MRADASFAVPVKLWALLCVFAGVTIGGNVLLTCILTGGALLYLVLQWNFRLAASYGCFYLLLALLLYGIRFHGLRMPVFSEFYVLMFWNLSPIFLVSWDLITTPPGKANTHKDNKKSLRATTGSSHLTVAGLTVYL